MHGSDYSPATRSSPFHHGLTLVPRHDTIPPFTMEKNQLASRSSSSTTIWVGGSSALTQTYMEEIDHCPERRFVLAYPDALPLPHIKTKATTPNPSIGSSVRCTHMPLDVTQKDSIDRFFDCLMNYQRHLFGHSKSHDTTIKITIIFGIRCSLVTGSQEQHLSLVENISYFLHHAAARFSSDRKLVLAGVLHVSSVAIMDHTKIQSMLNEDAPLPSQYSFPYDAMKRRTEDILSSTSNDLKIHCVHLRISGIFSNEVPPTSCIQMSAIRIQKYAGSLLKTPLDMNTSYNVCQAIKLILNRMDEIAHNNYTPIDDDDNDGRSKEYSEPASSRGLEQVYFYTRPTIEPRPYGNNLVAYRSAHNIVYCIDVPDWVARLLIWMAIYLCRGIAAAGNVLLCHSKKFGFIFDLLHNVAYLLTVSMVEHTFDNSRIRRDFPALNSLEESVLEGFVRIRNRRLPRNTTIYKTT